MLKSTEMLEILRSIDRKLGNMLTIMKANTIKNNSKKGDN